MLMCIYAFILFYLLTYILLYQVKEPKGMMIIPVFGCFLTSQLGVLPCKVR